jgi:hypothetical protein
MGEEGPEILFTNKRDITRNNGRSRSKGKLKGTEGNNKSKAFNLGVREVRVMIYYNF